MRRPSRTRPGLTLALALYACVPLSGQNLESFGKAKPFSFSGGLAFNQIFYASSGITARRSPYRYVASGNLNLSLYGWAIPLRFAVSDNRTTFSQPFNQYAVHPSWRWITAHAGYISLSWSPYTVNGHVFRGAAVDLTPEGKWQFAVLCGRFLRAVGRDTTSSTTPAYQRNGYGLNARYGSGEDFANLIVFAAGDDAASIAPPPDSLRIFPQQNLVVSAAAGKKLFRHFLLKAEWAASALTRDTRAPAAHHRHPLAAIHALFRARRSSAYYQALKASLTYAHSAWTMGMAYERIDPGYTTLGAYYFNNDLENVTANVSTQLMEGKINVAATAGIQRDNLDNMKVSSMRRIVSSFNITYAHAQNLNITASWSGFQTHTHLRPQFETLTRLTPYDHADTLTFTQISERASLSAMYSPRTPDRRRQQLTAQLSWQQAADNQGSAASHAGSRFLNIHAGYALNFVPQQATLSLTLNASLTRSTAGHIRIIGPTAALARSLFNRKFRSTVSASWNETHINGAKEGTAMTARWSGVLTIRNTHAFNISTVLVSRAQGTERARLVRREFTATAGYRYTFRSAAEGKRDRDEGGGNRFP